MSHDRLTMARITQLRSSETPTSGAGALGKVLLTQNFCHGHEILGQSRLPFDFLSAYHLAMEPIARRWDRRARGKSKSAKYARQRARALRFDPYERMEICGTRSTVIKCKCRYVRVPVRCGLRWLCDKCRKAAYSRFFRRARRVMRHHQKESVRSWVGCGSPPGERPEWKLVTLTVRHSGDLQADRARIVRAWKRWRQWLWKAIGKFHFAMTWELTAGRDSRGHLHAHVSALLPWFDFSAARSEWKRAIGDEDAVIHFERARKGGGGAAHYLAKYASKGVELDEMPPNLAANAIAANYGQRLINTSQHFWRDPPRICPSCHARFVRAKLPLPLQAVAPFGSWRAEARKYGVDSYRGPPPAKPVTGKTCDSWGARR